jgi:hypothetical protein
MHVCFTYHINVHLHVYFLTSSYQSDRNYLN